MTGESAAGVVLKSPRRLAIIGGASSGLITLKYAIDELVGWDISIASAVVTEERRTAIRALGTDVANFSIDIQATLHAYAFEETRLDGPDFPDPIAMAHAIDPAPSTTEFLGVDIAIGPDPMRGTMIVDHYGFAQMSPNAIIVTQYPEDHFFTMLYELLG